MGHYVNEKALRYQEYITREEIGRASCRERV